MQHLLALTQRAGTARMGVLGGIGRETRENTGRGYVGRVTPGGVDWDVYVVY